jgi:hypothetical protein
MVADEATTALEGVHRPFQTEVAVSNDHGYHRLSHPPGRIDRNCRSQSNVADTNAENRQNREGEGRNGRTEWQKRRQKPADRVAKASAEAGSQGRAPSPMPSSPPKAPRSSGLLSTALCVGSHPPTCDEQARQRRNAPLDEEQTRRPAPTYPHWLQLQDCEGEHPENPERS